MPLSPEQEWALVACGLVAHADGIIEVGEWDQVLWLLDDRIDPAEVDRWLEILGDRAQLDVHLQTLSLPPPPFSEGILEKAWRMALADGHGSDIEATIHDELAERLGVDHDKVVGWREQWSIRAAARAETIASFAAILATLDGLTDPEERTQYEALVERLPVTSSRREELLAKLDDPPGLDHVVGGLAALEPEDRSLAMLELVPLVRVGSGGGRERAAFLELAERVAISRIDAERMLDRV